MALRDSTAIGATDMYISRREPSDSNYTLRRKPLACEQPESELSLTTGSTDIWNWKAVKARWSITLRSATPFSMIASAPDYLGCATVRRYGLTVLKPSGYFCLASSSDTVVGIITSSPCFQFTGVATLCFAVS